MDDDRFDALTRAVGGGASRRAALRALIAATVGGTAALPAWLGPRSAAACAKIGARCGRGDRCCGDARCRGGRCRCAGGEVACGSRCANLLTDRANCGTCGHACAGGRCLHGACTCDPFDNRCPTEVDGQCGCGAVATVTGFVAACVDRNSACDLDRPCDSSADCPPRSVCLRGCSGPPDPQPNRCSKPCVPA